MAMDIFTACSIIEGFSGEEHTKEEHIEAWQFICDSGAWRNLQGFYGRNVHRLISEGIIKPKAKFEVVS